MIFLGHFFGIVAGAQGLADFLRVGFGFFRREPRSSFLRSLRFLANDDLMDSDFLELALVRRKILAGFFGCYYGLLHYFLVRCLREDLTLCHGKRLFEGRSGIKMMADGILRKNDHQGVLISKGPATLGGQSPLSLGIEPSDESLDLPLSYRYISDLHDYLIGGGRRGGRGSARGWPRRRLPAQASARTRRLRKVPLSKAPL